MDRRRLFNLLINLEEDMKQKLFIVIWESNKTFYASQVLYFCDDPTMLKAGLGELTENTPDRRFSVAKILNTYDISVIKMEPQDSNDSTYKVASAAQTLYIAPQYYAESYDRYAIGFSSSDYSIVFPGDTQIRYQTFTGSPYDF